MNDFEVGDVSFNPVTGELTMWVGTEWLKIGDASDVSTEALGMVKTVRITCQFNSEWDDIMNVVESIPW